MIQEISWISWTRTSNIYARWGHPFIMLRNSEQILAIFLDAAYPNTRPCSFAGSSNELFFSATGTGRASKINMKSNFKMWTPPSDLLTLAFKSSNESENANFCFETTGYGN